MVLEFEKVVINNYYVNYGEWEKICEEMVEHDEYMNRSISLLVNTNGLVKSAREYFAARKIQRTLVRAYENPHTIFGKRRLLCEYNALMIGHDHIPQPRILIPYEHICFDVQLYQTYCIRFTVKFIDEPTKQINKVCVYMKNKTMHVIDNLNIKT